MERDMLQKIDPPGEIENPVPSALEKGPVIDHAPKGGRLWPVLRAVVQSILVVAILAGAAFVARQMVESKPPARKRPVFKTVYTIETAVAMARNNQPVITAYGQTVAGRSVELRALVAGEIVSVSDALRVGARVDEGAPLLEIDAFNYRGALQEAKANLAEAEAKVAESRARIEAERGKQQAAREQLELARADLERADRLRQRGQLTQQQLETRKLVVSQRQQALDLSADTIKIEEARIDQMEAQKDRLQWRVDQADRNLESTVLKAPFAGIVRSSTAEIGRLVSANDVVVSMYDEAELDVRFTLTDAEYGRLQTTGTGLVGRPVKLTWSVGGKQWSWPGNIDRIGAEIASSRGGVEVFARVGKADNPVQMRPGAFVEISLPDQVYADSFELPDTALYGSNTVYVAKDGKLEERSVEVLAYQADTIIVGSGLTDGDQVLTTRITEVSAGLAVRIEGDQEPGTRAPAATGNTPIAGRPSREEMAQILQANNLTRPQFRALSPEAKRKLIRDWRQKNG